MSLNKDIWTAASEGDLKTVAAILDANPRKVHAVGSLRQQPIHWAARYGRCKMVTLLLDRGAKINARSRRWGMTPVGYASTYGCKQLVKLLANRGADLTVADHQCRSPLWFPARTNNEAMVNLLLRCGAPVDLMSAVHLKGPDEVLSRLKRGEKFPKNPVFLQELAGDAILAGSAKLVECILDLGISPSSSALDESLLQNAISRRATDIVRLLLDRGASLKCIGGPRESILKYCGRQSAGPAIRAIRKLLVKAGAR